MEDNGYEVVQPKKGSTGDITVVLQKIQELIVSSTGPGHLVILSGGGSGWLENLDFAQRMNELLASEWKIDVFAWQKNTKSPFEGGRWYDSHKSPLVRFLYLEFFTLFLNVDELARRTES